MADCLPLEKIHVYFHFWNQIMSERGEKMLEPEDW